MTEPARNSDYAELTRAFREKLGLMEYRLRQVALDPILIEGYRTPERQNWLWMSGRQRVGPVVTKLDGYKRRSLHQFRAAADYWFKRDGRIFCTPDFANEWKELRACAEAVGLVSGASWAQFPDLDHVQMPGIDTQGTIPDKEEA